MNVATVAIYKRMISQILANSLKISEFIPLIFVSCLEAYFEEIWFTARIQMNFIMKCT